MLSVCVQMAARFVTIERLRSGVQMFYYWLKYLKHSEEFVRINIRTDENQLIITELLD